MSYKRGDVVLVYCPYSDYITVKQRPALVVQADDVRTEHSQLIVAQITSNLRRAGYPSRVLLRLGDPAALGSGLRTDSVIVADNLATLDQSLIKVRLGTISDMSEVDRALKRTLAL